MLKIWVLFLEQIFFKDIIISLIISFILLIVAKALEQRLTNPITKRYYMPFVVSKILYAFFFVILHSYVYKGGDTFLYFAGAKFILSQIAESPENISTFLFTDFYPNQQVVYTDNFKIYYSFRDKATLIMSQITAIITFLGVKSFLATNILFSYLFSFGIWHLFSRVVSTFPQKIKLFAQYDHHS